MTEIFSHYFVTAKSFSPPLSNAIGAQARQGTAAATAAKTPLLFLKNSVTKPLRYLVNHWSKK